MAEPFTKGDNPMFVERVVIERSRTTGWWYVSTLLVAIIVAIAVGFGVAYGLFQKQDEKVIVQTVPFWPAFVEEGPSPHWSYNLEEEDKPENWGTVRDEETGEFYNPLCKSTDASTQSPIALPAPNEDSPIMEALNKSYPAHSYQVVARPAGHPGFQIKADVGQAKGYLMVDGDKYNFVQFHFHSPSEHTWDGKQYPLEVHFVHQKEGASDLAVFGILFDFDPDNNANAALSTFWDDIFHARTGLTDVSIDAIFAQANRFVQRYDGSLTTPPCTEGVKWHVAVSEVGINEVQKLVFTYALNGIENFRPVQPLNGREIVTYNVDDFENVDPVRI